VLKSWQGITRPGAWSQPLKNRPSAVIASEAKQSTLFCAEGWIASSLTLLAMTMRTFGGPSES
jgi:hypothetical protein